VFSIFQTQGANVFGVFLSIATSVIIARILGVEGRGEYSLVLLFGNLITTFLNCGIPSAIVYYVGGGRMSAQQMIKNSLLAAIGLGIICLAGIIVFGHNGVVLQWLLGAVTLTTSLKLIAISTPLALYSGFLMNIFLAENKITAFNFFPLFSQCITLASILIIHTLGQITVLSIVVITVSVQLLITLIMILRRGDVHHIINSPVMRVLEIRHLFIYALPSYAANLVQFVSYRIGPLLVGHYHGFAGVGIYTLATGLAEFLWLLSRPVATVLFPKMSTSKTPEQHVDLALQMARFSFYITIVCALIGACACRFVIPALYGYAFSSAVSPFLWLLPGTTFFSIVNVLASYLAGIGKPELNLIVSVTSTVFTVILTLILLPHFGLTGAAIATSTGYFISTILTCFLVIKIGGISLSRYVLPPSPRECRNLLKI
jgi:O-antigen/teichoic acid export membrane protein